jgi:hypothetical protein
VMPPRRPATLRWDKARSHFWERRFALPTALALLVAPFAATGLQCSPTVQPAPAPEGGASCAGDPLACPAGETCWPIDTTPTLACIVSRVAGGGFLAACDDSVGIATCASGMACDAVPPTISGACTYYCDPSHACPSGYSCVQTRVGGQSGPVISVCRAG